MAAEDTPGVSPPAPWAAELVDFRVTPLEFAPEVAPFLEQVYGIRRMPLAPAQIELTLAGVPRQVVNALRRAAIDETEGHALRVDPAGVDGTSTDPLVPAMHLRGQIEGLRLRPDIPEGIKLRLSAFNATDRPMTIYAGDLEAQPGAPPLDPARPLFNPTTRLAVIQPGQGIVVREIRVERGLGRINALSNVAVQAAYTHLDLPARPEAELQRGADSDLSGYAVSSMEANPRRHRLTFTVPAAPPDDPAEAGTIAIEVCAGIATRLRAAAAAVEKSTSAAHYAEVRRGDGIQEGTLTIAGETHTLGGLLTRAIYDLHPGVSCVTHTVDAQDASFALVVSDAGDVRALLLRAIGHAVEAFETLRQGALRAVAQLRRDAREAREAREARDARGAPRS